jgi:hypothetical protein
MNMCPRRSQRNADTVKARKVSTMAANNVAVGNVLPAFWPTARVNNDCSNETTDNPLYADDRNFYKVEKSTKDGTKVDRLLYAGNNLEKPERFWRKLSSTGRGPG